MNSPEIKPYKNEEGSKKEQVAKMFNNHLKGVCNAMVESFSNAMAKRLNGKIQEIKTVARGYRTFKNFRSAILFFNGGLQLKPLNLR